MPLVINTNVLSLNAQRHLGNNTNALAKSMEKLSSGFRINRASDDAAGLALSESLRTQIRGSEKALGNVQDGMNMLNVADGALQTIQDNLQRMRELTVQAANDTYSTAQRTAIATEINALISDIDRIANSTKFNNISLLADAGVPANFYIQVGANGDNTNDRIDVASALGDMTTGGTTVDVGAASVASNGAAQTYLGDIDDAITAVSTKRGNLGALVNRLEGTANNLAIAMENFSASESRIRNVDVAAESANLVRNQILQQASNTILAQANQTPGLALQLLQGG